MKLEDWIGNKLSNFCRNCSGDCCNLNKMEIEIEQESLSLFEEEGIPIVLKDSKEVPFQMPYVKQSSFDDIYWIKSDNYCPLYDEEKNICRVYNDKRKPEACSVFPYFIEYSKLPFLKDKIILGNCTQFDDEFLKDLKQNFPNYKVIRI